MDYKPTTALTRISNLTKPVRVVSGGQGAGKTIALLMLLINSAQHKPGRSITVAQSELSKAKRTVVRDFIAIMKNLEFYDSNEWNKSENIYRFDNGSYIEFIGLDSTDIGKGFRRDILYINEANRPGITLETFIQLQSRCKITFVDYNPDALFWVDTDVLTEENAEQLILTHEDNEELPTQERTAILSYAIRGYHNPNGDITDPNNIKSSFWANKHIVYCLGLTGKLDNTIYTDWEIYDSIPEEATLLGTGLDFGFVSDESASVIVYKLNDDIIIDELFFEKGLTISSMATIFKSVTPGMIYADAAEPRSINELHRYGLRVVGAKKGAGSVLDGIKLLQAKHMIVTRRSKNVIKALENYKWLVDDAGNSIPKPNHNYSDILDALRYLAIMKLRHNVSTSEKKYSII
jgi:phage terminase large subunit